MTARQFVLSYFHDARLAKIHALAVGITDAKTGDWYYVFSKKGKLSNYFQLPINAWEDAKNNISNNTPSQNTAMKKKHRGKSIKTGEWVYGFLIVESLAYGCRYSIRVLKSDLESSDTDAEVYFPTIGKYLGTLPNGQEVYDGDYVFKSYYPTETMVAEYSKEKFCCNFSLFALNRLKVRGNIHDKTESNESGKE